jgi:flagellar biosynthesis protein FlhG
MQSSAIRVAVGGGKGGVGKSLVAVNLAASLAESGARTVLVDTDLGAPNLHTLLGVSPGERTIQALLERRVARLEEVLLPTSVPRLTLVAGASGLPGSANPSHAEKGKLLRHIASLDADVVVLDIGAGTAFNALDFFALGEVRLMVATPEITSLQNAYCFAKTAVMRVLARSAKREGGGEALWNELVDRSETSRLGQWLGRVRERDAALAVQIEQALARFSLDLVGNRVISAADQHAVHALGRMTRDYLGVRTVVRAVLPPSSSLRQSVAQRIPAVRARGTDRAVLDAFQVLATHVLTYQRAGAAFDPPENTADAEELIAEPGFGHLLATATRNETRIQTSIPATLVHQGAGVPARIIDLSRSGMRVSTAVLPGVGDRVMVEVRSGRRGRHLHGLVRHVVGQAFGVALDADSRLVAGELLGEMSRGELVV